MLGVDLQVGCDLSCSASLSREACNPIVPWYPSLVWVSSLATSEDVPFGKGVESPERTGRAAAWSVFIYLGS